MHRCLTQSGLVRALGGLGGRHPLCLVHALPARCRQPQFARRHASAACSGGGEGAGGVREAVAAESQASTLAAAAGGEPRVAHTPEVEATFASLGVAQPFVEFLKSQRITQPSAVQAAAIPVLLRRVNAAMQAQTGSGKTLAYLLPVLTNCFADDPDALRTGKRSGSDAVLCLVVAPSQELAMQIVRNAEALLGPAAKHLVAQCIGGANTKRQLEALKRNKPALVVGSPGRLAELSLLGHLKTHHVKWLILDEADELLARPFVRHLARLAEHSGAAVHEAGGRVTVLVSATLAPATLKAYAPWCANPELVRITGREQRNTGHGAGEEDHMGGGAAAQEPPPSLPQQLRHMYVHVPDVRLRVDTLRRAMHALDSQRALVFLNFGRRLQDAQAKLASRGMAVGSLHGGQSKMERTNTLAAFRAGKLRALLVTDLAARGLDVPECDAVFNLELPSDPTHYAHRAGRTARAGQPGICVTLVDAATEFVVRKFERGLDVVIEEAKVGGGEIKAVTEILNARVGASAPDSEAKAAPVEDDRPARPKGVKVYKPKGAPRRVRAGAP